MGRPFRIRVRPYRVIIGKGGKKIILFLRLFILEPVSAFYYDDRGRGTSVYCLHNNFFNYGKPNTLHVTSIQFIFFILVIDREYGSTGGQLVS